MYNIKYLLMKNEDVLIATLAEDDNVVLYLDGGEWIKFVEALMTKVIRFLDTV